MVAPRTFVITGAGRGLGLALAEACVARGHHVIGTLRDESRGAALVALAQRHPDQVQLHALDVSDAGSCTRLAQELGERSVDVLINNAGINSASPDVGGRERASMLRSLDAAALERMLRTNALGALLVTRALLPQLARTRGARVVNVSSRRGSLAGKLDGGNYGYCMSKAALNMATRALAADLAEHGVVAAAVDPGCVLGTGMSQRDATLSPAEAAQALLALVDRLGPSHAGRFLNTDGTDHAW